MTTGTETNVAAVDPLHLELACVLGDEAYLLDHGEFGAWFELLAEDLEYRAFVLDTVLRSDGRGDASEMFHFDESHASMQARVDRLGTSTAWAEDPPSRTRRFIDNVRVSRTGSESEFGVRSYLLVLRTRSDWPTYQMLTCERQDLWRRTANGWRLRRREAFLDQTALAIDNLTFFL